MYIYTYTHIYICIYIYIYTHTHTHIQAYINVCLRVKHPLYWPDFHFIFYFPNGRYVDYLSLACATNINKTLQLHYKHYKFYKQHSR